MSHPLAVARWQAGAACMAYPATWWFPDRRPGAGDRAKEICADCPVRAECLTFAITRNEDHGIWGGFGIRDIDEMKRTTCLQCGRVIPAEHKAELAIAGVRPRRWRCRPCWYRRRQETRRT